MLNLFLPNLAVCLNSFMSLCSRFNAVCFLVVVFSSPSEEVRLRVVRGVSSCAAYLKATFKLFLCAALPLLSPSFARAEFSRDLCEIRRCLEERVPRRRRPPVAPQLCQHPRPAPSRPIPPRLAPLIISPSHFPLKVLHFLTLASALQPGRYRFSPFGVRP